MGLICLLVQEQLIIIIVTTMNTVTDSLKKSMAQRHNQQNSQIRTDKYSKKKEDFFQQKFMEHFETINKTPTTTKQDSLSDNQEVKFKKTLIDYSSKTSPIDAITLVDEDAIHMVHSEIPLVVTPIIPGLKSSSIQTIKIIKDIFLGRQQKQNNSLQANSLMVIEYYSQILKDFGRKDIKKQLKLMKNTLAKNPTYQQLGIKQVQTEDRNADYSQPPKTFQKTSRKELILMQLIRQKKRKNFAPDYFTIMEMKLMEFLEFILEDQPQYVGLDPHSKVREILKNLESFQGKMVEGESKINLLRIFFEEFTDLKRQKDQLQAMKNYTPMKGLENRQKNTNSTSGKFRATKQTFKQSKITQKDITPLKKQTQPKTKKEDSVKWMNNERYQQAKVPKQAKRNDPNRDEWIGFC